MGYMATEITAIDKIDREILGILQTDGRISWQMLGDRVHLSPNAVAERVRRLTKAGVIKGFRVEINQAALGRTLEAVIDARMAHTQGFDDALMKRGVTLLEWLLNTETIGDHLSVTPVGGKGPNDIGPLFDQQPIEVAALADALHRAHVVTSDKKWLEGLDLAASWFMGNNDASESMIDLESGGGYDGLHANGVNLNQGAESTLAMISTMQHCSSSWLI